MYWTCKYRSVLAAVLATALACSPAHALVSLNEGRDRLFVSATASISRDSNIFANSDNRGDCVYSTSLSAEYTRRAGWIGVNANASVSSSRFTSIKGQDFDNPSLGLEFTKRTGRTTGSLTLAASRESRADASVNLRSTSWNIPVGLNFKYPIVGVYTLAGSMGYSSRRYLDESVFTSLSIYSATLDLFRILSTEREMIAGYRYRYSESSRNTASTDHALSLGLSGKLIRGVKGNVRVGYQTRGVTGGVAGREPKFDSWTASGSSSYSFTRKLMFSGMIAKDFSTTATNSYVDTTNASLQAQFAYNSHWNVSAGADFGDSRFLGQGGRVVLNPGPPVLLGRNRHDNYFSWNAAIAYSMNEHLKASLGYSWFQNWSSDSYADFIRSSWTASASTRW